MGRKSRNKKSNSKSPVNNSAPVQNGLGEALGFPSQLGFPANQANPFSAPLSNVDTTFSNLRYYLVSNMRQFLNELYVETGLVQTIVDVPVDDGLRGGIEIKSKQLDESQIEDLQVSLDRDNDILEAGQAAKWNRLFGGAGILIMTDQDPETPLDLDAINEDTPLEFRAVDMWELFWDKQNTEGYDPELQTQDFEYYSYYAIKLHKSRVMRLKGLTAPSFIRPRLRGWGFSVVETLIRALNQYLKATDLGFEVLDEFKLDVFKIKNLTSTLFSPQGEAKVRQRVQMANWGKNYQNAIVLDQEDDYDHKQLSFAGLAEAMQGIRMQIASEMRMPLTKIFGISAAGFNSGEDDIEVYNAMVESQVRNKLKYDILRICEIKCQKLFGFIPDDLQISFKPLRMLSAEQEENVKTQKFNRLIQAKQLGELTTQEFRDACNKGDLFDVKLDTTEDALNPNDPEVEEVVKEGKQDPARPIDVADPGANREDTRKERAWEYITPEKPDKPEKPKKIDTEDKAARPKVPEKAEKAVKNSPEFDRRSYEADGGDAWIDPRKRELYENPGKVDEALWSKAKEASMKAFGRIKWQFVTWWYKKQGGKFQGK